MKNMSALVLCAGKSTRISSISQGRPKPLIEIAGEPVLFRNLRWLARSGIREVWINLHYKPEEIKQAVGDGSSFGLSIKTVYEPEILGTAGALKNLAAQLTETFLVISGDNIYSFDLEKFYADHRIHQQMATIALFHRKTHMHTGIAGGQVLMQGGWIQNFIEGSAEVVSPYVNAGAYFFQEKIMDHIPFRSFVDFGKDLFPKLLREGNKIAGHVIEGFCLGIDTPESYACALQLLVENKVSLL